VNKEQRLAELQNRWSNCTRCGLCKSRRYVVFGEGNPNANILIVGEGPGAEEDSSGRPFVGEAGKALNTFLRAVCLRRNEDVYITNTVACRPFTEEINEETGKTFKENRPPSTEERAACKERLLDTIYIIDPFLIIALGKVPVQTLLGKTNVISKMRGKVFTMHLPGKHVEIRYPVLAMYHPAFLLRNLNYSDPEGVWYQTGRDFKLATEIVDHIDLKYFGKVRKRNEEIEEGTGAEETDE